MKKLKLIGGFSFLICIATFTACKNQSSQQIQNDSSTDIDYLEEPTHQHPIMEERVNIELNNGNKWQVNESMKPFVEASQKLVNAYLATQDNNYKNLADLLVSNDESMISSCTMTGKSHDELHKWLNPHLALVNKLQNANSEQEAKDIVKELQQSFDTYNQYFQ